VVLAQMSKQDRAKIVLFFFALVSFIMLTPILIVLRWDETVLWPWMVCFIPIFVLQAIFCIFLIPPPDDADSEEPESWGDTISKHRVRAMGLMIMTLLVLLEVFVALRLDKTIDWSWHFVLAPWSLLEFMRVVDKLAQAGRDAEQPEQPVTGNILRLALAFTIAAKLNGDIGSWELAFIPYFIFFILSCVYLTRLCFAARPTDGGPRPQDRAGGQCCILILGALWISLVIWRLDEPNEISSLTVMLPFFIPPYLLCCCVSCLVLFPPPPDGPQESSEEFEDTSTEGLLDP